MPLERRASHAVPPPKKLKRPKREQAPPHDPSLQAHPPPAHRSFGTPPPKEVPLDGGRKSYRARKSASPLVGGAIPLPPPRPRPRSIVELPLPPLPRRQTQASPSSPALDTLLLGRGRAAGVSAARGLVTAQMAADAARAQHQADLAYRHPGLQLADTAAQRRLQGLPLPIVTAGEADKAMWENLTGRKLPEGTYAPGPAGDPTLHGLRQEDVARLAEIRGGSLGIPRRVLEGTGQLVRESLPGADAAAEGRIDPKEIGAESLWWLTPGALAGGARTAREAAQIAKEGRLARFAFQTHAASRGVERRFAEDARSEALASKVERAVYGATGDVVRRGVGKHYKHIGFTRVARREILRGADAVARAADRRAGGSGNKLTGYGGQFSDVVSHLDSEGLLGDGVMTQIRPVHRIAREKWLRNLRAKVNPRWAESGKPPNPVTKTKAGHHIAGEISPQDWVARINHVFGSPQEIEDAARWYETAEPLFRKHFGADADRVMRAFAVSQANASPSGGLKSVLRAMHKIDRGEEVGSVGSVVADSIEAALKGEMVDKKMAAKLSDFVDALRGKKRRTWMGNRKAGGAPAPIDIWGLRDLGYIDAKLLTKGRGERIAAQHGVDLSQLKLTPSGASGSRYERASEKYQEITDHLNEIGFNGRSDWTPAQTQALGWAGIQRFHGSIPEDLVTAITKGKTGADRLIRVTPIKKYEALVRKAARDMFGVRKANLEQLHQAETALHQQMARLGPDSKEAKTFFGLYNDAVYARKLAEADSGRLFQSSPGEFRDFHLSRLPEESDADYAVRRERAREFLYRDLHQALNQHLGGLPDLPDDFGGVPDTLPEGWHGQRRNTRPLSSGHGEPSPDAARGLLAGRGRPGVRFTEAASADDFIAASSRNPRQAFLTQHTPEELADHKLFLSADGNTGYALSPQGDLKNVFRNPGGVPGAGRAAVAHAIENGATTLDAFDNFLPDMYAKLGFVETGRMRFVDEYAPDGWDFDQYGRPDVVFMAHGVEAAPGRYFDSWDEAKQASQRRLGDLPKGWHGQSEGLPHPDVLNEARDWLADVLHSEHLTHEDLVDHLGKLDDDKVIQMVDRRYEGGWDAFVTESARAQKPFDDAARDIWDEARAKGFDPDDPYTKEGGRLLGEVVDALDALERVRTHPQIRPDQRGAIESFLNTLHDQIAQGDYEQAARLLRSAQASGQWGPATSALRDAEDSLLRLIRQRGTAPNTPPDWVAPGSTGTGDFEAEALRGIDVPTRFHPRGMEQSMAGGYRGAVEPSGDGRYILHLFANADASTVIHEMGHAIKRLLSPEDIVTLSKHGLDDEETFARTFEAYFRNGEAPTMALRKVFRTMSQLLRGVYADVRDIGETNLNPDTKAVFDRFMTKGGTSKQPPPLPLVEGALFQPRRRQGRPGEGQMNLFDTPPPAADAAVPPPPVHPLLDPAAGPPPPVAAPLGAALRRAPGIDSRPATVTLVDGSKAEVNPLHPLSLDGKTVNLLDGNTADASLVREAHAGDGTQVFGGTAQPVAPPPGAVPAAGGPPRLPPPSPPPTAAAAAPTPDPMTVEEAGADLMGGMGQAERMTREQKKLRKIENGARTREYQRRLDAGYSDEAARAALKGPMPTFKWDRFTSIDNDLLAEMMLYIRKHPKLQGPDKVFTAIRTEDALRRIVEGGLPRPFERKLLRDVFGADTNDIIDSISNWKKVGRFALDLWSLPRTLLSTLDLSFPLRQGLGLAVSHPVIWGKQFWPMLKSYGNKGVFEDIQRGIAEDPNFDLMQRAGIPFTELGAHAVKAEEAFPSSLAERIPYAGAPVKASNRAYVAFGNKSRQDYFNWLIDNVRRAYPELDLESPEADKLLQDLGRIVGNATGRGRVKNESLARAMPVLNQTLFSPRLLKSRLDVISYPATMWHMDKVARREAYRQLGGIVALASGVTTLTALAGGKVTKDPRNADWGKVRVGNKRFDLLGGYQQPFRLMAQLATGTVINSVTGEKLSLGTSKFGAKNRLSVLGRFGETKLAPPPGFLVDLLRGTDFDRKPFSLKSELEKRLTPLLLQDAIDASKEGDDFSSKLALFLAIYGIGVFGVGTQVYGPPLGRPKSTLPPASVGDYGGGGGGGLDYSGGGGGGMDYSGGGGGGLDYSGGG